VPILFRRNPIFKELIYIVKKSETVCFSLKDFSWGVLCDKNFKPRWFLLASCPKGNKLLQSNGCSWASVLEECMHIQKASRGSGNTQDKQHIAAPKYSTTHSWSTSDGTSLCSGRVLSEENESKEIMQYYVDKHLRSSGQGSWLQIQRSGFDCRRYHIFWEVVGLERGPLSLVRIIEQLRERKVAAPV
jgi:hypothetical protein